MYPWSKWAQFIKCQGFLTCYKIVSLKPYKNNFSTHGVWERKQKTINMKHIRMVSQENEANIYCLIECIYMYFVQK